MSQPVGLVGLHHPRRRAATRGGARWPPTAGSARSRSPRRRSSTTSALLLDRHRDDRVIALHPGQRHRLRSVAPVPDPGHHPPDARCASAARSWPGLAERTATARWSPRRCSTKGSTSRRPTWRSSCRGAGRCASTCSASGASCAAQDGKRAAALRAGHRAAPARPSPASGGGITVLTADLVSVRRRGEELRLVADRRRAPGAHRGAGGGAARPSRAPTWVGSGATSSRRRCAEALGPRRPRRSPARRGRGKAGARRLRASRRPTPRPRPRCGASCSAPPPPPGAPRREPVRSRGGARRRRPPRAGHDRRPTLEAALYADRPGAQRLLAVEAAAPRRCWPAASSWPRRRRCCCGRRRSGATVAGRRRRRLPAPVPHAEVPAPPPGHRPAAAGRAATGSRSTARSACSRAATRYGLSAGAGAPRDRRLRPLVARRRRPLGRRAARRCASAWRAPRTERRVAAPGAPPLPDELATLRRPRSSALGERLAHRPRRRPSSTSPARASASPISPSCARADGARVYFELLGFWSREAVWRRIDLVRAGLPHKILFAASKSLRVGEALLDDAQGAALYVFSRVLNVRPMLDHLERLAGGPAS